jgi:hypothetical protein
MNAEQRHRFNVEVLREAEALGLRDDEPIEPAYEAVLARWREDAARSPIGDLTDDGDSPFT